MAEGISAQEGTQILGALRERCRIAIRAEKGRIFDEFVAVAKCRRKHAERLSRRAEKERREKTRPHARQVHEEAVRAALVLIWAVRI